MANLSARTDHSDMAGGAPGLDSEPDQVGRPHPAQDLKHFGGCLQDPVQAERDA